ncbi:MAG TPA: FliM/FliN family flagellar motor switch protein [Planctomicrobium sp.]|nr:FliM/FliN family flagellar motor switch protein [Planctomicrobium sp.]
MSQTVAPGILDFYSPRRPPSEALRQLSAWQSNVCDHVRDGWAGLLARQVKLIPNRIEPVQYHTALSQLPDDGLGIYFSVGESLFPSMMVFSSRQVQALLADLLDLPGNKWPAPARLTAAEDSVLELLFQKLAESIGDGWPGDTPLPCRFLETTTKPQRTRLFPVGAQLFAIHITVDSRFGQDSLTWLLLKEETERLVEDLLDPDAAEEQTTNPNLISLVERVPLDVVVELGRVELSMSQIHNMSVGDVLVLDQLVTRPLTAHVEGSTKWVGVPKRIGGRQAFEISQVIEQHHPGTAMNTVSGSELKEPK